MPLLQADKEIVIALAVDFVIESYKMWKLRQSGKEPDLTATIILDYVLQHGKCPTALKYSSRRQQQTMIRSVLDTAKRRKLLGSSFGAGDFGKKTRCYEPFSYLTDS